MPWVRLDEMFPEHPKVLAAGGDAAWLHVCAIAYCNRHLTDGFVPAGMIQRLSDRKKPLELVKRLIAQRMWEVASGGWQIHDFHEYQMSRAKVEEERAKARERMARNRNGSPEHERDVRPNIPRASSYPTRPDPTSLEKTRDDDDSVDTPARSSSVDQIINTAALAIALKSREHPGRSYIAGIARNLRSERLDEIQTCITQGLSVHDAAIKLDADPWFVTKALNGAAS